MQAKEVLEALKAAVGPKGWLADEADKAPYLLDARGLYHGAAPLVLLPDSTERVAEIVQICSAAGIGIVPQGGNTGYVGGSVPDDSGGQVLLSLARMNRIRDLDPLDYSMTVEAGCILAAVQQAAAEAGRLFPLSLAAEGSCQIGGNLSTNAGGIAVLRYGNARDLVLGLEVVLPNGAIWNGLRRLRKDNTGYNLKQLFLGAEGTLGIITAAVLRLFPQARQKVTALVAVTDEAAATALLSRCREASGDDVTSFEYIARSCLDLVLAHLPGAGDPFTERHAHHVLLELRTARSGDDLTGALEQTLGAALEAGEVVDAVVAANEGQASRLWALRETIPEAQKAAGASIKHDVSVPVSRVPTFLRQARALSEQAVPGVLVVPFGHLGDGNIHFNLTQPAGADPKAFLAQGEAITRQIHDLVMSLDGSFSAEHGIGRLKRGELQRYRSAVELETMAALKAALDPKGLMNPGKVL